MNEKDLKDITTVLAAFAAMIAAALALFRNIVKLWNNMLWPFTRILAFLGTLAVPTGIIIWFFMDLAAENSSRLDEQVVILSLAAQETAAVFLFALFWGMLLCPKIRFLLKWSAQHPTDNDEKKEESESKPDTQESGGQDGNSKNGEGAESQDS